MKNGDQWIANPYSPHIVPTRSLGEVNAMRRILNGEWKEVDDTQEITFKYFRSIVETQLYVSTLEPWRME